MKMPDDAVVVGDEVSKRVTEHQRIMGYRSSLASFLAAWCLKAGPDASYCCRCCWRQS